MKTLMLLIVGSCGALAQSSYTIAWVSDHGVCVPQGLGFATGDTGLQRGSQCVFSLDVAAGVRALNPDFIVATGDLSNTRGNRAETYGGIMVRTATPVTCPSPVGATTLSTAVTGSAVAQTPTASGAVAGGSGSNYAQFVINCGQANAEVIQVTTNDITAPYTFTAKMYKNHSIGEPIQANAQTISVETSPLSDCGPGACRTDMMLLGSNSTYTFGSTMSSIVCAAGTCTASITNTTLMAWKVGDEVVISGIASLPSAYYTVSGAGTTTSIVFPSGGVTGTFDNTSNPGATLTVRRLLFLSGTTPFLGFDEETASNQFEVIRISAVTRDTFTATFAHPHASGVILRGSDQIPYLDYIRQGKFLPVIGNHEFGCAELDWCETGSSTGSEAFNEYWGSAAGGSWPLTTVNYHDKSYGNTPANNSLIRFFATATWPAAQARNGQTQELYMTPRINASTAKWNIGLGHHPPYTDSANSALNAMVGVGNNPQTNYSWLTNQKFDMFWTGHLQFTEYVTARNADNSNPAFPYFTMGASGDAATTAANIGADGNCVDPDVNCTVVAGGTTAGGAVLLNTYVFGKVTVNDTDLKVRLYTSTDWVNAQTAFNVDLTKAASTPADPCVIVSKFCAAGGVVIR